MRAIMREIGKAQRKIRQQSGETIAETLVALLISSIALMMLASMISATANLVTKSETKMGEYYTENAKLENSETSAKTLTISITSEGEDGIRLNMTVEDVPYQTNSVFSKTVVAYSYSGQEDNSAGGGDSTNPPESGG